MNLIDFVSEEDAEKRIEVQERIDDLSRIERAMLHLWVEGYTQAEKYEYLKKIYAVEVKEGDALDEESENIRENVQRARAEEVEAMIERLIDAGNTLRDWRQPNRKRVG